MQTEPLFIGRENALKVFNDLLSKENHQNILYIQGDGGMGKTRLLQKLVDITRKNLDNQIILSDIIDFYYTENRTLVGLQDSIVTSLEREGYDFSAYRYSQQKLTNERIKSKASNHHQELEYAKSAFDRTLSKIAETHTVVLLFDTCETITDTHGYAEFFRDLSRNNIKCVISGRSVKNSVIECLKNSGELITEYQLEPFSQEEIKAFICQVYENRDEKFTPAIYDTLYRQTEGIPLLLCLLAKHTDNLLDYLQVVRHSESLLDWEISHNSNQEKFLAEDNLVLSCCFAVSSGIDSAFQKSLQQRTIDPLRDKYSGFEKYAHKLERKLLISSNSKIVSLFEIYKSFGQPYQRELEFEYFKKWLDADVHFWSRYLKLLLRNIGQYTLRFGFSLIKILLEGSLLQSIWARPPNTTKYIETRFISTSFSGMQCQLMMEAVYD